MPSSANVSRGNSSLSGSSSSDIEGAEKQSPVNPRSFDVVSIETCGNKNDNPCQGISLYLYNVMGQEDVYRHQNGERVQRGGMARVVVTTNIESNVDIEYTQNPSNEDNPNFDNTLYDVSKGRKYHEFFFVVIPSSLYAFRLHVNALSCPEVDEISEIYYFETGSKITIQPAGGLYTKSSLDSVETNKIKKELSSDNYFEFFSDYSTSNLFLDEALTEDPSIVVKPVNPFGPVDNHGNQFTTLHSSQTV